MTLYFDLDLRRFTASPGVRDALTGISFKRGDTVSIDVVFFQGLTVVELGTGASGKLGLKEEGEYSADYITAASSWTKTGTGTATKYTFALPLTTSELNALLAGDVASVALMMEMQFLVGDERVSSETITATVYNDVIKDDETGPTVITGGTPVNQTSGTSTLTVDSPPSAAATLIITVGAEVETWTFRASATLPFEITTDADEAVAATNIITALAASDLVTAAAGASTEVDLTAAASGTSGQYVITGTVIGSGITESGDVAAIDATAGYLGTMQVDADYLYVVAAVTSGVPTWKKAALSAL